MVTTPNRRKVSYAILDMKEDIFIEYNDRENFSESE